jgi:hypothetical protein
MVSPATSGKLLSFRVSEAGQFVCVVDPDPHGSLDPYHFEKLDPDPSSHQSGKMEALEGHFGELDGPNLGKK